MKNIALLGSTGSIGRNVLDVVRHYPDKFRIKAITSNKNVSLLAAQAEEFSPETVTIGDEKSYSGLKEKISQGTKVTSGAEALEEIAIAEDADIVFIAISGTAALKPLMSALKRGKTVALASKEPIISAGEIIMRTAEENSARILPVDSEHSAIMQCLAGRRTEEVRTLYITGSGGSLKDRKKEEFNDLSVDEVLALPVNYAAVPTDMDMEMHMFGLMGAPSDWLTGMLMIPYVRNTMDHRTKMGGGGQVPHRFRRHR